MAMIPHSNENFYELAWQARSQIIDGIINDGEQSLYRVLKLFEQFEAKKITRFEMHVEGQAENGSHPGGSFTDQRKKFYTGRGALFDRNLSVEETGPERYKIRKPIVEDGVQRDVLRYSDAVTVPARWVADMAADGYDAIVELGSGYGRNLFEIYFAGGPENTRYIAAEYTNSGRKLCEKLADLEPGLPMETVFLDHKQPDFSFLSGMKRVLVFSCHSIEQVAILPDDYFKKLVAGVPFIHGIHFEPFGFQMGADSDITKAHDQYIRGRGYNLNLYPCLQAALEQKIIDDLWTVKEAMTLEAINPTSIAVWTATGRPISETKEA